MRKASIMPGNRKISTKRKYIDRIDEKVLALLNRRSELSLEIRELKKDEGLEIYDPVREDDVVSKLCARNKGPMSDKDIDDLFKHIMKINRGLPDKK